MCHGIRAFCTKLTIEVPDLDHFLPASLFTETGLQNVATYLAEYQSICIVDKGAGELWGFCAAWVWDQVQQFMCEENFQRVGSTPQSWGRRIS